MTEQKDKTPTQIKKEVKTRISSWLNTLTHVQLKHHIRELMKTSDECYDYFAEIVGGIDSDPKKFLDELSLKISKLIIPDKRYYYGHNINPKNYGKMIDYAETLLGRGVDKEVMDIMGKFSNTLGEQYVLFENSGDWYVACTEVCGWLDEMLDQSNLSDEYKLLWRAKRLLDCENQPANEHFEKYIDQELSKEMLDLIADAYIAEINKVDSYQMGKLNDDVIIKVLKKAQRIDDISSTYKSKISSKLNK
ncbi:MAG: hypothetical protein LBF22_02790 [Deltaproteobacteria bacterium]|jgi:hypothetical protein|nr:hypothetical protein [Deltaproteobacteria bacterium]